MDLDKLFGEGAELGDVVVKAQLRFRVHPPKHPVAQDIVDRIVVAYDERLELICRDIDDVLRHADSRRTEGHPLVLAIGTRPTADVVKAVQQPYQPGSHGGKWYRDGQGHIRYGEKPQGQFRQRATSEFTMPHLGHYQPSAFLGEYDNDQDLTGYLLQNGDGHGFSDGELRLLGAWYGTDAGGGALFDAFLDCAGLTRADLKGGVTHLRFGSQGLTYEEAVFEFFAAQAALFLGEEPSTPEEVAEWHRVLNDDIKPLLDSAFGKYEALKQDTTFQERFLAESGRQQDRFFAHARKRERETRDLANWIVGEWDPEKQVSEVIAGMSTLGLFAKRSQVDSKNDMTGRANLYGALELDGRLFPDDQSRSPLLSTGGKLSTLSASQLMLLYAAAELHRRWDPETRSYSGERQEDAGGSGQLGGAVLEAIAAKSRRWQDAIGLVRKHLDELVDRLVDALNSSVPKEQ